jgi:hypothetical protein
MLGALRVNARCVVIRAVHDPRLEYGPCDIGSGLCRIQIQPFAPDVSAKLHLLKVTWLIYQQTYAENLVPKVCVWFLSQASHLS